VRKGVYVSSPRYAANFDHPALVSGIARTYAERGLPVRVHPPLPGGKRADLAVSLRDGWTYIEIKTRADGVSRQRSRVSLRQDFLRELMRLRAHCLRQLPRKEPSLVVVSASASSNRKRAMTKIALARSFAARIFEHNSHRVLGLMLFAPFRSPRGKSGWKYASALIPNPNRETPQQEFQKLGRVQL